MRDYIHSSDLPTKTVHVFLVFTMPRPFHTSHLITLTNSNNYEASNSEHFPALYFYLFILSFSNCIFNG
jgi:hypothetical protein